MKERIY